MNQETEKLIVEEFSEYFPNFRGNPTETCLAWGLDIGEGWSSLFHQLCRDIKSTNPPEGFKFEQIKEKFGGLRVYVSGSTQEINSLIDAAENESYRICESCGASGSDKGVKSEGAWITTLCHDCRNRKQNVPQ